MNIGSIRGIKLKLHYSVIIIAALIAFSAGEFYYSATNGFAPLWALLTVGIASGIIIIFSIFLHEIMHSLVAQRYGMVISEIELYLFGGVSKLEGEPKTPGQEATMAAIGPITSLALAGIFYAIFYSPLSLAMPLFIVAIIYYTGWSNLILGIFNFLPAFPMDGGRVLRALLWSRRKDLVSATRGASKVGTYFAYGMMIYGFFDLLFVGDFGGLWFIILGGFLNSAAKQSYVQTMVSEGLARFPATQLLGRGHPTINYGTTIRDAIRDFFIPYRLQFFPVEKEGRMVGIVFAVQVQKISPVKQEETFIGDIMVPIQGFPTVYENATGKEIMEKIGSADPAHRVVLVRRFGDGFVIGMVGEAELQSALEFINLGSTQQPGVSV